MRYGVEAARQTITTEISSVFGVYGISVDHSNLALALALALTLTLTLTLKPNPTA